MKKKLTIAGVFVAIAAFSLVGVAAASAHGIGGSSERLDRVAEILGVSPDELSSAMEQARSEARTERLEERLATAIEDEVITAEEADAIRDWVNGRPDAFENLERSDRRGLKNAQADDALAEFLAGLVADEVLTQAEADEIAAWLDAKPTELIEELKSEYGSFGHGKRGHRGFGGHHGFGGRGFGGGPDGFPRFQAPESNSDATAGTATSVQFY